MLVTVSGERKNMDQSLKTLRFASRATYIQNKSLKLGTKDEDEKNRKADKLFSSTTTSLKPRHLVVNSKGYATIPTEEVSPYNRYPNLSLSAHFE